jgi:hypothetical protein
MRPISPKTTPGLKLARTAQSITEALKPAQYKPKCQKLLEFMAFFWIVYKPSLQQIQPKCILVGQSSKSGNILSFIMAWRSVGLNTRHGGDYVEGTFEVRHCGDLHRYI